MKLLLFFFLGVILMTFIGIVRENNDFSGISSLWNLGIDLVINNRSLYVLMEYADENGYTLGISLLMQLLSVIPFLQSIFLFFSGMNPDDITSAGIVTKLYFENTTKDRIGLGTNAIGDIYVAFGLIGVVILMYGLGRLMKLLYRKAILGNSVAILLYALIFMDAIYMSRSSILGSLRPVLWTYTVYLLSNKYLKNTHFNNQ